MMDEAPDHELVQAFLTKRDESSFRILYERFTPRLFLLTLRLLSGRKEDAEDALQETWIRAVSRMSGFRWESKLSTWLSGIAIHCCQEMTAKNLRLVPAVINSDDASDREKDFTLEDLIRNLPEGYRQVLILHDIEGYTHQEIAQQLQIEPGTSKSQLFDARKWLRERIRPTQLGKTIGGTK